MNTITVEIEKKSFEISKNKIVTGVIFIKIGNRIFPEQNWNDFVIVILKCWLASIKNIVMKNSKFEILRFMEGDLYFKVESDDFELCKITCYHGNRKTNFTQDGINILHLLKAIDSAATLSLAICHSKGWISSDISDLKEICKNV